MTQKITRRETAAKTKALILDAARMHFRQYGWAGTTMRDIATSAGVSTGAIFSHFVGKDALWEATMGSLAPSIRTFLYGLAA